MRDYRRQAAAALQAYLDRGREALASARELNTERLNHLLVLRRAAFHNFRVADALVSRTAERADDLDALKQTWEQIKEVDVDLTLEIQAVRESLHRQISRCSDHRAKLRMYRSGRSKAGRVETPV